MKKMVFKVKEYLDKLIAFPMIDFNMMEQENSFIL